MKGELEDYPTLQRRFAVVLYSPFIAVACVAGFIIAFGAYRMYGVRQMGVAFAKTFRDAWAWDEIGPDGKRSMSLFKPRRVHHGNG